MKIKSEFSAFENRINEFVKRYEMKYKKRPYLYEVCNELESIDTLVLRGLNKLYKQYPGSLVVTTKDKILVDMYKQLCEENGGDLTIGNFSQKIGKGKGFVANHKKGMEKLGVVFKGNRDPYKTKKENNPKPDDGPVVYIRVKQGAFKGATGYIESMTDTVNAMLWFNGNQTVAKLETCEYDEIKKVV